MNNSKNARQEREVNAFACALLMPKDMFEAEIKKVSKYDLDRHYVKLDYKLIEHLAKTFQVPNEAVVMRMTHLKLI